ncbi:hypothetical protein [Shewanella aestuarii]|uniref:Uncharacterized protein n=1 Tax=Shewanella aestuarii TaxID=1028752 RepID=A0A6G9QJR0_9GAMM|nr:hypothetical protein [Shewanella aestuarii]QIR14618.1 hypothetical protein HBH39_09040 [Shewanella aestuarii]
MSDLLSNLDDKLVILFRLEPGCLGPDGLEHIEVFCNIAERALQSLNQSVCRWRLTPRYDKSLDEVQYSLAGKVLPLDKAIKYLQACHTEHSQLMGAFEDKLTQLINQYLDRKASLKT